MHHVGAGSSLDEPMSVFIARRKTADNGYGMELYALQRIANLQQ
jgi:hypothetical protein